MRRKKSKRRLRSSWDARACGKKLRFDLAPFLLRVHTHIINGFEASRAMQYGVIDQSDTAKMFGGGKTQARKTPLKLCAFILCRMMGVATVVLTTNVSGREDLFGKFIELLGDISVPHPPATIPSGSNEPCYRYYRVKQQDEQGRKTTKITLEKTPRRRHATRRGRHWHQRRQD